MQKSESGLRVSKSKLQKLQNCCTIGLSPVKARLYIDGAYLSHEMAHQGKALCSLLRGKDRFLRLKQFLEEVLSVNFSTCHVYDSDERWKKEYQHSGVRQFLWVGIAWLPSLPDDGHCC